jgi:transposase
LYSFKLTRLQTEESCLGCGPQVTDGMYSEDLLWRGVLLVFDGYTYPAVAQLLRISTRTIRRVWGLYKRTGGVRAGRGFQPFDVVSASVLLRVDELVKQCPDLYLDEYCSTIRRDFGVTLSVKQLMRCFQVLPNFPMTMALRLACLAEVENHQKEADKARTGSKR